MQVFVLFNVNTKPKIHPLLPFFGTNRACQLQSFALLYAHYTFHNAQPILGAREGGHIASQSGTIENKCSHSLTGIQIITAKTKGVWSAGGACKQQKIFFLNVKNTYLNFEPKFSIIFTSFFIYLSLHLEKPWVGKRATEQQGGNNMYLYITQRDVAKVANKMEDLELLRHKENFDFV